MELLGVLACVLIGSINVQDPEAISLFGKPLYAGTLPLDTRKKYEDSLAKAQSECDADRKNVDKYVWVGRRLAYLGRFREAIKWFAAGKEMEFEGANVRVKLLRHLGHRYISLREFDAAEKALTEGCELSAKEKDEVEPDGMPNARNIPIGTVHSNVYYHLGLAQYLKGNLKGAIKTYETSQTLFASNADRFVSTAYWQALAYAKLGEKAKLEQLLGSIKKDLQVIENQAYHRLLLYFKGEIAEKELLDSAKTGNDSATIGYGVAAWRLHGGRSDEGISLLRDVLKGEAVFAFGYIAAEVELKRLGVKP